MGRNSFVPYMQLADEQGNPLVVNSLYDQNYKDSFGSGKLLDWNYYPLTDWQYNQVKTKISEVMINAGVNYKIVKGLEADIKYQYQRQNDNSNNLHTAESYYARNYVNRFSQIDSNGNVIFIVPKGGIIDVSNGLTITNNIRGQLSYSGKWDKHQLSAIAGAESRDAQRTYNSNRSYGYNENKMSSVNIDYTHQYPMLPSGSSDFIQRQESQENVLQDLFLYSPMQHIPTMVNILFREALEEMPVIFSGLPPMTSGILLVCGRFMGYF
jgi:hypothetical protein